MRYCGYPDRHRAVVDQIEDPIVTAPGRVGRGQRGNQWPADAMGVIEQRSDDECVDRPGHFLGESIGECRRGRSGDLKFVRVPTWR